MGGQESATPMCDRALNFKPVSSFPLGSASLFVDLHSMLSLYNNRHIHVFPTTNVRLGVHEDP